ncbi:hypothetical protein LSM04_000988 [Trypanosoma melophagium]|uniref:uncharacterized protein n=1 Tax=Trypanosoma melophagium TaxID=715481 RepID=UPI00351A4C33|nr:hypothetical protein LSM04_000988 [Trypanosoma melophagium]
MIHFTVVFFTWIFIYFLALGTLADMPVVQYPPGKRRVLNCDKYAESMIDCDPDSYRITVWVFAAPGVIVACIMAIGILIYVISKYLCNCCGGRKQSPNFCFPLKGYPARYSRSDLHRPLFLVVISFLMSLAACIWGCIVQSRMSSHFIEIKDITNSSIKNLEFSNAEIIRGMTVIRYDPDNDTIYNISLFDNSLNAERIMALSEDAVNYYSNMVKSNFTEIIYNLRMIDWIAYTIFIIPTTVSFGGVIIAVFNYRKYASMCVLWLMAFFGIVIWGCNGLYAASSFLIKESCFEVSEFTNLRINVVKAITECNESHFSQSILGFNSILYDEARTVCEKLEPYCYDTTISPTDNLVNKKVFDCPIIMPCATMTDGILISWLRTAFYTAPEITQNEYANAMSLEKGYTCTSVPGELCDLSTCATSCEVNGVLSEVGKVSKSVLYAIKGLASARSLVDNMGSQVSSCDGILSTLLPAMNPFCQALVDDSFNRIQSSGLMGLAIIIAIYGYGMGAKRFIPFNQAYVPQND